MSDFMVDRAYWDPGILDAARACNANAVAVYAYDHYIKDDPTSGYCGGYSPEVVAQIYAEGFDVHFVFVFRDGEAPLDPARCVEILTALDARPGAWVHNDIENGAMDSLTHDVAFNQAMRAAGYHSAPYGLASTLNLGYLQDADGAWVASYVRPWDFPPYLFNVPNVGAWDFIGWQYSTDSPAPVTVDVSVHNFPVAGAGKGAVPVVAPVTPQPPTPPTPAPPAPSHQGDVMPVEVPSTPTLVSSAPSDITGRVNCAVDRLWLYLRNPAGLDQGAPVTGRVVAVNADTGAPVDFRDFTIAGGHGFEWDLTSRGDVVVGVLQAASGPLYASYKVGTRV